MNSAERMREGLRYADHYRQQASAADGLGMLLECETPGTVKEVSVKRGRWFWRREGESNAQEIILSTEERREFAQWCKERADKLRKQAEETEERLTNPPAS